MSGATSLALDIVDIVVLAVDDDPQLLHGMSLRFRSHPFRLLTAAGAHGALRILENEAVDVILVDEGLPGIQGSDFLGIVQKKYPHVRRIMFTGDPDEASIGCKISDVEVDAIVAKPCRFESLVEVISMSVEKTS